MIDSNLQREHIMYLNGRRAMENKSWTEKFGVNQCALRIRNKVLDEKGTNLMDDVIERVLGIESLTR